MTTTLALEQQRLGERPARPEDEDAVRALADDDARVLARLPPSTFAANVRAAADRQGRSRDARPALLALPALAAAAALALVVVPGGDTDRLKGADTAPALEVFVDTKAGPAPLVAGAAVRAGEVLQLRLVPRGARYGVVVSLDGRGAVTRHFPDGGDTALPAASAALPFSFELDDAPGFERFFLVTSEGPLDAATVERAVRDLARRPQADTAPLTVAGASVRDVLLRKSVDDGAALGR
jgi:hypothetical protein